MVKYKLALGANKIYAIEFLKNHPEMVEFLKGDDLNSFFNKLRMIAHDSLMSGVVKFLYKADIDVLSYIDYIPGYAFVYKDIEDKFTVPSHIKGIYRAAFMYSDLKELIFEEGCQLEHIEDLAFAHTNLSGEIYLPDSIKRLCFNAFIDTKVTEINVPKNCIIMGYSDFKDRVKAKLVTR